MFHHSTFPLLTIRVSLCNLRAAEVCSAEATELPVWKRPPVSVANGLCHPWALDPGSATPEGPRLPGMTQLWGLVCFVSGLGGCPKRRYGKRRYFVQAVAEPPCSTFPGHFQKTGSRVSHPKGAPSARDDTALGFGVIVSTTSCHTFINCIFQSISC